MPYNPLSSVRQYATGRRVQPEALRDTTPAHRALFSVVAPPGRVPRNRCQLPPPQAKASLAPHPQEKLSNMLVSFLLPFTSVARRQRRSRTRVSTAVNVQHQQVPKGGPPPSFRDSGSRHANATPLLVQRSVCGGVQAPFAAAAAAAIVTAVRRPFQRLPVD